MRSACKSILRFALQEASEANAAHDDQRQCRAQKLFLLVPRMLPFRSARGGLIPKSQLRRRFERFVRGEWIGLPIEGENMAVEVSSASRRRRTWVDSVERRAERAQVGCSGGDFCRSRSSGRCSRGPWFPNHSGRIKGRDQTAQNTLPARDRVLLGRDCFLHNLRCAR